ncbi:MAG: inositol monophosphatase family protein [Actinomycetota bacterium]
MTTPPAADPQDLAFAIDLAEAAGAVTLEWFQHAELAVEHKGDGSPVTIADRDAESLVRARLAERFPDDGVVGEEHDDTEGTSGRRWVVDPIDGTKAFTKGVPLYSTLIALIDDHGPAVGVIHLPGLGETVAAGRGLGATANGAPCQVSAHDTLDGAYATTSGFGYWPPADLQRLLDSDLVVRTWGDAYGYALVATGRAEAMIDPLANPWDVAPMAVIIPEAGGRFSNYDGVEQSDSWQRYSGVATNGRIHDDLLTLFDT